MGKIFQKIFKPDFVFVLGMIFLIGVPVWIFFVVPNLLKLPNNFSYEAETTSVDNFYNEDYGDYQGEQYSVSEFKYFVEGSAEDNLLIRNIFNVRTSTGEEIFSVERLYGIDPKTGAHVKGLGDKGRDGYLFAPRGLKAGESFIYWHVTNDIPGVMKYVGEENLYGLKVFKYETDYDGALVDLTAEHDYLSDVPESKGLKLNMHLELWVEPVSGHLVKSLDYSNDYFYYNIKTGEKLGPFNKFINKFSEDSVKAHVEEAQFEKSKVRFCDTYFPLILVLIALWLLGFVKKITTVPRKF
ncbi:MAG: porin PorA family protein [Candidatus Gracilibacteria bacterium]|jgi:hypothetical protein